MESHAKANPKARFGVSKEKRNDRLVTLGLGMHEHGFLHRTGLRKSCKMRQQAF